MIMNRKKNIAVVVGILICGLTCFAQNEESIARKVTFRQELNVVVIEYRIPSSADVSIYYSDDEGQTFTGPLVSVTGDVGRVEGEGKKKVYWWPLGEIGSIHSNRVCFKVIAIPVAGGKSVDTPIADVTESSPVPVPITPTPASAPTQVAAPKQTTSQPHRKDEKPVRPALKKERRTRGYLSAGGGLGMMDGNAAFAAMLNGALSFQVGQSFGIGFGAGLFRTPTLKTYQYTSSSFSEEAKVYGAVNILAALVDIRIIMGGKGSNPYLKLQGGPGFAISDESMSGIVWGCASAGLGYPILKGLCLEADINFCGRGEHVVSENNLISAQWASVVPVVGISYKF